MEPRSSFRERHIRGASYESKDVNALVGDEFDYVLLSSSWDARCLAITSASALRARVVNLLIFQNRGQSGRRDKHDAALQEFAARIGDEVKPVVAASEDLDEVWRQLSDDLDDLRKLLDRPLKVLVDLTTCPRFYSLALIARAFNERIATKISVLYSEAASYPPAPSDPSTAVDIFTTGRWETTAVPGLEGDWYPTKPDLYVVALGLEADKTALAVAQGEPSRVKAIVPRPGRIAGLDEEVVAANASWMALQSVTKADRVDASPLDAVAAWQQLSENNVCDADQYNAYMLLSGSKPLAVACGVHALARESPAVLYVKPARHVESDLQPSGISWRYDFEDLSAPI